MSKKEIPVEPARVYLDYYESRSGGAAHDPSDQWSSHDDVVVNVEFKRLHRTQPPMFFYDSFELSNPDLLKLDKLYMAVVRYLTGNTFGSTVGMWHVVGFAPTYDIAQLMLNGAVVPSKPGDYRNYKPWEGYFERLLDVEVHTLELV